METHTTDRVGHYQQVTVCHGAGSTPDVARTLMPETIDPQRSWAYLSNDDGEINSYHRDLQVEWQAGLANQSIASPNVGPGIFAGISLGAHAVALWAKRSRCAAPLVFALPAWTGAPHHIAAMTSQSADSIEQDGLEVYLGTLSASAVATQDWIVDALQRSWGASSPQDIVQQLRAAARSTGPTLDDLASLQQPTLVIALEDDPMHPLDVADTWATALPRSELVTASIADVHHFGSLATPRVEAGWRRLLNRL